MTNKDKRVQAVAYIRTSSAANVGSDKDSDRRQQLAIKAWAKAAGVEIVETFTDEGDLRRGPDRDAARLLRDAGAAPGERRADHRRRDGESLRARPDRAGDRLCHAEGARHRADRSGQARCFP
jgi:Resolvase, N terminal domain